MHNPRNTYSKIFCQEVKIYFPASLMLKQIYGERMREKPEGDFSVSSEDFK